MLHALALGLIVGAIIGALLLFASKCPVLFLIGLVVFITIKAWRKCQ